MPVDLEATAQRVEGLLDRLGSTDPQAGQLAEDLVAELIGLHTAGLERVLAVAGEADPDLPAQLAEDPLVAGLLSLHDLHPDQLQDRVEAALDKVRPYLDSHGGGVDLVDVSGDGVVTLRLQGSCDGCAASQITLETAVEDAIRNAAPEVAAIEVDNPDPTGAPSHDHGPTQGLIPLESLTVRSPLPVEAVQS